MNLRLATYIGVLVLISTTASKADQAPLEFKAGIKVEGERLMREVAQLLQAYATRKNATKAELITEQDLEKFTFYFAAGRDYLQHDLVAPAALDLFDNEGISEINDFETNTDVCYIQGLTLKPSEQRITLVVYNLPQTASDDVFRCLVAGLWRYQFGSLDGINTDDWQATYRALLETH